MIKARTLRSLYLEGSCLADAAGVQIIKSMPSSVSVSFSNGGLSQTRVHQVVLPPESQIGGLRLSRCPDLSFMWFSALPRYLRELDLSQVYCTSGFDMFSSLANAFSAAASMPLALQHLNISKTVSPFPRSAISLVEIALINPCIKLVHLDISG
jgi:hypothetical protein